MEEEVDLLGRKFVRNNYPDVGLRERLAQCLGVEEKSIKVWLKALMQQLTLRLMWIISFKKVHRETGLRAIYLEEEVDLLGRKFVRNNYPDVGLRERLAQCLGVEEKSIKVWLKALMQQLTLRLMCIISFKKSS